MIRRLGKMRRATMHVTAPPWAATRVNSNYKRAPDSPCGTAPGTSAIVLSFQFYYSRVMCYSEPAVPTARRIARRRGRPPASCAKGVLGRPQRPRSTRLASPRARLANNAITKSH